MNPSQLRVVEDVPLDIPSAFPLDTDSWSRIFVSPLSDDLL